ncbi:unnamed protein product, partial [Sphagnum balticum]
MRVVALRRRPENSSADEMVDTALGPGHLLDLMAASDYVVVTTPLTPETKGMINSASFKAAKQDQVFINIGRGPVVVEEALIEALTSGRIRGAALDVFTNEPLPQSSPLWATPNLIISPHGADYTVDSRQSSVRFFTENCERFLAHEELLNIVD